MPVPIIQVVVLTWALSGEPIKLSSGEKQKNFCFDSCSNKSLVLRSRFHVADVVTSAGPHTSVLKDFSSVEQAEPITVVDRFRQLAAQWSVETSHVSSVTRAVALPSYQAMIKLGWDVVPLMLKDLQSNTGFWYPALNAITGIRPFDPKDAGNTRRMTEAWITWGRKKGLI